VLPPAAARDDVVDAGRDPAAVHAAAPVAGEQGAAGERNGPPVGHPDETLEPDHAGGGDGDGGAVGLCAGRPEGYGVVVEDEDARAAGHHRTDWLVRRVPTQVMRHGCTIVRRRRVAGARTMRSQFPLMPGGSATMSW